MITASGESSPRVTTSYPFTHQRVRKTPLYDGLPVMRRLAREHLQACDEEIIEHLIQVKGIGRWTAQMFLILALERLDVFPVDDLGIRIAIALAMG